MFRMLLLVDGYNVTMRDPATVSLSKEGQREALIARLRVHGGQFVPSGSIVVVFDAKSELGHSSEENGRVKAVYAAVADDEIVRRCTGTKGQITVVTDDLRLRARISQDVGRHIEFRDSATVFDGASQRARKSSPSHRIAREGGLPPGANKITEELKGLWLSEEDQ
jgi:predicted RNA-binding protein with PIN domain